MKRLVSMILAVVMLLGTAQIAFADGEYGELTLGGIYDKSGSYYSEIDPDELTPGETYYIGLGDVKPDRSRATARWDESSGITDGDKVSLASSRLDITRGRYRGSDGSTMWGYFAVLELKSLSSSKYDDQGYWLSGTIDVGDPYEEIYLNLTISFPQGSDEITDELQVFSFDDEDEVYLDLPYDDSYILVDARGVNEDVFLSMNTDYDSSIGDRYPTANLDFLNGNGGRFRRNAEIYIYANGYRYLYRNDNGKLTDLSRNYDRDEDAFIFKSRTLDSYILSDTRLTSDDSGSSSSGSSSSSSGSSSSSSGSSSSGKTTSVTALYNLMTKFYSNECAVLAFDGNAHGDLGRTANLMVKMDLSKLNTSTLRMYAYNETKNQLISMPNANIYVDSEGYLRFSTPYRGLFVLVDSALTLK